MNDLHAFATEPDAHRPSYIGVRFDRASAEARACWLTFPGPPALVAPEIKNSVSEPIAAATLRQIRAIEREPTSNEQREAVAVELTSAVNRLCVGLVAGVADSGSDVVAIGIHGDGVWESGLSGPTAYRQLVDPARVAEELGKTVIDDFPSRDLAQGGIGGPIATHGLRMLLADRPHASGHRWKALLHISPQSTHICTLDPLDVSIKPTPFCSVDVCVGGRFVSELKALASRPEDQLQAVRDRGEVLSPLFEIWSATSHSDTVWKPEGISPLPLIYALQNSAHADAKREDQMATANYFICRQVADFICHAISPARPIGELLLMGEGTQHGQIAQGLTEMLPGVSVRRLTDLGKDRTVLAAAVAALAMLHTWQSPVSPSDNSGIPRVLGRITPGSPSNWQRVLGMMAAHAPWQLPIREAI